MARAVVNDDCGADGGGLEARKEAFN